MDALTRRKFLIVSGVAGSGALATGATGITLVQLLRTARERGADADPAATKLVIVTLYGGNDGLNTVVPYADPVYQSVRQYLSYKPEQVLKLNGALGLNPTLTGLKRLWDRKRLAIVLGVGYPRPDRSHFRSMDIWQSASPNHPASTGWVGRWLDGTNAPAEAAVSFEPVLPPLLAGATRAGACVSPDGLSLPGGMPETVLTALGRAVDGEPELQRRAAVAFSDLLRVDHAVTDVESAVQLPEVIQGARLPGTATGGETALGRQLGLIARCVEAGVPTRVYSASLGGFDTHADERQAQEGQFKQLDSALTAFVERMEKTPAGRRVVVLVYSEFGRRVHANGSDGTDHGTAGPVFLIGPRVAGGFYGEQPSLNDLDDGDLKATTDFRDVYGEVLASVLDAEPERYLPGFKPRPLPLIRR